MAGAAEGGGEATIASARPAASPNAVPGHYELRDLLGRGGFASVYEAWDSRLQRVVAIKCITLGADAQAWLKEARLAARITHRAVVTVHDVFVNDGHGCIVMERVEGRSLSSIIANGPAPEPLVIDWMLQAAEAFGEAHAMKVLHGDIKPANLMVDDTGRLRVLDFGVACALDRLATSDSFGESLPAGTLAYMAPEQLLGLSPSIRTDIYALGLVLQELLSGRRVHEARPGLAIVHHKLHDDEAPIQLCAGTPLTTLARRMTARHPQQRPESMEAVARALRAMQRSQPIQGSRWLPRLSRQQAPAESSTRRRLAIALLLTAAIGTAAWCVVRFAPMSLRTVSSAHWVLRVDEAEGLLRRFDEEGQLDKAVGLLEGVLAERPGQPAAAAALAMAYCLRYAGDQRDDVWLKRAELSAQMALRGEDQLANAHAAQAWVMNLQGRWRESEPAYRRALALDQHNLFALNGLAHLLIRMQQQEEAHQVLDSALATYPKEPLFLDALGGLLFQQGDHAGAEKLFRASISARPTGVAPYVNLHAVLLRTDRVDEAQAVLQQGLRMRPDPRLYTGLGNAMYAQGHYFEAAEAFERAVSAAKGSPNDYLMWANLGDALRWVPGREAEARQAHRRALQLLEPELARAPQDAKLLSRAGLYAAKMGEIGRARVWIDAALARAGSNPDLQFRAAMAAEVLGDRDKALAHLRQALARGYPSKAIAQEPELQALRRDVRYHQMFTEEKP